MLSSSCMCVRPVRVCICAGCRVAQLRVVSWSSEMRNVCKKKSVATVKSIKNQSLSSADDHPSSLFCHLAPAVGCSCTGCTAADPTHTPSHPAPRLRPRPAAYATYRTAHVGPKCRSPLPPPAPPLLRSPRPRAAQPRSPQGLAPLSSARRLLLVQPVRHVVAERSPLVALGVGLVETLEMTAATLAGLCTTTD